MATNDAGLSLSQRMVKRAFDLFFSVLGLLLSGWLIVVAFVAATIDTRSNGFFIQQRVGKDGKVADIHLRGDELRKRVQELLQGSVRHTSRKAANLK